MHFLHGPPLDICISYMGRHSTYANRYAHHVPACRYDATGGSGWTKPWNTSAVSVCAEWYGVSCDAAGNRVTSLFLKQNGLSGPLPASLATLDALSFLSLGKVS